MILLAVSFFKQLENCVDSPVDPRHLLEPVSTSDHDEGQHEQANRRQSRELVADQCREKGSAERQNEQKPKAEEILGVESVRFAHPSFVSLGFSKADFQLSVFQLGLTHGVFIELFFNEPLAHIFNPANRACKLFDETISSAAARVKQARKRGRRPLGTEGVEAIEWPTLRGWVGGLAARAAEADGNDGARAAERACWGRRDGVQKGCTVARGSSLRRSFWADKSPRAPPWPGTPWGHMQKRLLRPASLGACRQRHRQHRQSQTALRPGPAWSTCYQKPGRGTN